MKNILAFLLVIPVFLLGNAEVHQEGKDGPFVKALHVINECDYETAKAYLMELGQDKDRSWEKKVDLTFLFAYLYSKNGKTEKVKEQFDYLNWSVSKRGRQLQPFKENN